MKRALWMATALLAALAAMLPAAAGAAELQWDIVDSLRLETAPRDVAVSLDGRRTFILTETGDILVYEEGGRFLGKMTIGPQADSLRIGQDGERLYVISRSQKTVQAVQLDFVRQIDIAGAHFKGPDQAPVVIAVFSDFQ